MFQARLKNTAQSDLAHCFLDVLEQCGNSLVFHRRHLDDALAIWKSFSDSTTDALNWAQFKRSLNSSGCLTWDVCFSVAQFVHSFLNATHFVCVK